MVKDFIKLFHNCGPELDKQKSFRWVLILILLNRRVSKALTLNIFCKFDGR